MEIEITSLLSLDQFALSHSIAEGGQSAGRDTWNASLERAMEIHLLDTPDKIQAMRDFAQSSGGWDDEEIAAWSDLEVNALFLQWVAGDVRECPAILDGVEFDARITTESRWDGLRDESGALVSPNGNTFVDEGTVEWYYADPDDDEMELGPFETRSEAYWNHADSTRPPRADSLDEIDWPEYEIRASDGQVSGNLFRADDGRIYFYLGN